MRSALHIRMADDDSMGTSPRSDPNRCRRFFCICPTSLERPPTKIMWSKRSKSALRKRLEKKPPKHTLYVDNMYPWTAYKALAFDLDDMQAICVYIINIYIYSIHVMSYIPREFTLLLSTSNHPGMGQGSMTLCNISSCLQTQQKKPPEISWPTIM